MCFYFRFFFYLIKLQWLELLSCFCCTCTINGLLYYLFILLLCSLGKSYEEQDASIYRLCLIGEMQSIFVKFSKSDRWHLAT